MLAMKMQYRTVESVCRAWLILTTYIFVIKSKKKRSVKYTQEQFSKSENMVLKF